MPEAAKVRRLFAGIARRYDLTNDVLSLGIHRGWRGRLVRAAGAAAGDVALDVCCGTGDVTLALRAAGARVVGVDFCREMLAIARQKTRSPAAAFVAGDALRLPFADGQFDAVTVAFGIRNVEDPTAGLREMARVCRPGGRVAVLEFCRPRAPLFGAVYRFYFRRILPRLGAVVSGDRDGAYRHLQETVDDFPEGAAFVALMQAAGLHHVSCAPVSLGIASIYRGVAGPCGALGSPPVACA